MLTINVPNMPPDTKCDLTPGHMHFEADVKADQTKGIVGNKFVFDLDFFEEIDVENSKKHLTAKCLYLVLRKAKSQEEYWPRLTKEKVRLHNVKTDFDKWVDEDEQTAEPEDFGGMGGGFDPSMLAGAGGAGGAGGMGGMDLQQMMAQMGGGAGGMPDLGGEDDDEGDEDGDEAAQPDAEAKPSS